MPTIPLTIGSRSVCSRGRDRRPRRLPGRPAAIRLPTAAASRWASIAACGSAWSSIRNLSPRCTSKERSTRRSMLSREHQGPRAVLNALERLAGGYGSECDRLRQDLAIAESQLRDYQARLGKPFPHDAYLTKLTSLRDQLKTGLSGGHVEPGTEAPPTVSELADQIKALRAANTIEAAPPRTGQRRAAS